MRPGVRLAVRHLLSEGSPVPQQLQRVPRRHVSADETMGGDRPPISPRLGFFVRGGGIEEAQACLLHHFSMGQFRLVVRNLE
jgi:hypothetical protein